jgi:hypothetical protein
VHQQSLIVDFEPKLAIDSLPILLNSTDIQKKALKLVMDIAGPRDTMHPFALKMYGQIEDLLCHQQDPVEEVMLEDTMLVEELDPKADQS